LGKQLQEDLTTERERASKLQASSMERVVELERNLSRMVELQKCPEKLAQLQAEFHLQRSRADLLEGRAQTLQTNLDLACERAKEWEDRANSLQTYIDELVKKLAYVEENLASSYVEENLDNEAHAVGALRAELDAQRARTSEQERRIAQLYAQRAHQLELETRTKSLETELERRGLSVSMVSNLQWIRASLVKEHGDLTAAFNAMDQARSNSLTTSMLTTGLQFRGISQLLTETIFEKLCYLAGSEGGVLSLRDWQAAFQRVPEPAGPAVFPAR
jgi:hypothetical protein